MRRTQPIKTSAICAIVSLIAAIPASGALVGGTYTNSGAPGTSWAAVAPATASPLQYQTIADPTTANVAQGFVNQDASGTGGALMSEIITPTTTFTLDTISVEWAGAAPTPAGQVSLHLYTLGTRTPMPNLATDASAFYFVTTDLLGGGTGLPFFINGVPSTSIVNFTLDNTGTTDQVTLTAGTSYAVEFWNVTDPYSNTPFTWMRTPNATISDPGGQGFAHPNTTDFVTSRNTIAANAQAGGAPRTFAMALYGTAVGGITGDYNQNGVVDAADYVVWREQDGTSGTGLAADGDGNGMVDSADYDFWQARFGNGSVPASGGASSTTAVPEPAAAVMICLAVAMCARRRSRRTRR